ncbi:MAG: Gfo/Idh/MocA family oxidoreductase [Ignavibacteria bacterium]
MKKNTLNIGLTGIGHLGKIHCRLISEIAVKDKRFIFNGVYDVDRTITDTVSKEYNVKGYSNFDDMLREIDTLIIVTPTSTHFETAKQALDKDINIFIEKPVTSSLDEAEMLIIQSKNKKVKIQVGHVERFNPALVALEKFELNPKFIESHRLSQFNPRGTDVSVIQDLMIHDIDIILHLANSPVVKIDANGVAVISDEIDIANARLTLENGCVANLTSSRISLKKMRKMRIFQSNAYISVDFLNNKSEVFRLTDKNTPSEGMSYDISDTKKIIYEEPKPDNPENINPIKNELESFFESIIKDTPVKVTLAAGKEAVEVADKIINIIKKS